jgi:hypothetical protein
MISQGEKRETRKGTSQHAVPRTNQDAMQRGERSIFIGRVWNVKDTEILILGGFDCAFPEIGNLLARTDPDAAGLTAIEQSFHWF